MHRHSFDQCQWGKDLHITLFQLLRLVDAWTPPDHVLTKLVLLRLTPFESYDPVRKTNIPAVLSFSSGTCLFPGQL